MAGDDDVIKHEPSIHVFVKDGAISMNVQWGDELTMRGLLDKARSTLDDYYRAQNMPKVLGANGMPDSIKRHLRG
jgi:hypothetical protein